MNRMLIVSISALALGASSFAGQLPESASYDPALPLVQVEHLIGDQRDGFRQSCLLVYADGRYHREIRQQQQRSGRPSFEWYSPKVFEGTIGADDLRRLKDIGESQKFRAITGTAGDPAAMRSKLVLGAPGVMPHDAIDIFEASFAHSNSSQVFAVVGGTASRDVENSLRSFVEWVAEIEKRKEGRLDRSANGCAIGPLPAIGSSWKFTTRLVPTPIYSPDPDYPVNATNTKPAGKVMVHAIVNADGSVGSVSVRHGTDPALDRIALDAVAKWKFAPAQLNGMAIPMTVDVEVSFHLR